MITTGRWRDFIATKEDEIEIYQTYRQAYELATGIEECYQEHKVKIKIRKRDYNPRCGDGFKFKVSIGKGTRVETVEGLIPTVAIKLNLPHLWPVRENGILYFATFSPDSFSPNNSLMQVFCSEEYNSCFREMKIAHPVGIDEKGDITICDFVKYPHMMVSGTTRSGKSTALKCFLASLLQYSPDKINLILADRGYEFSKFDGLPHLSYPVIYDPEDLAYMFLLLEDEMERRTELRRKDKSRFLNHPYIVCVIDEFSRFIGKIKNNKRTSYIVEVIGDILRFGRNVNIHFALSVHDPKDDIIVVQKSDIPVGLMFQTVSSRKSMNAFGRAGAEQLGGEGEMIFHYGKENYRLKGFNIGDEEIGEMIDSAKKNFINSQFPRGEYGFSISDEDLQRKKDEVSEKIMISLSENKSHSADAELQQKFCKAVLWVLSQTRVSANLIQNELHVANKYASDFYEELQSLGILGDRDSKGRREVRPCSIEDLPIKLKERLNREGISDDKIANAIAQRSEK